VVKALVGLGAAPGMLAAKGVGPLAPAASNRTDEGRALNRRVEIIEQR
jgi:outer membrane protein OmpA-like peptidoglycan-associated protein